MSQKIHFPDITSHENLDKFASQRGFELGCAKMLATGTLDNVPIPLVADFYFKPAEPTVGFNIIILEFSWVYFG